VNGAFACENVPLLHDILRHDWGFDGFVTSDFGAVQSTIPSITTGLDIEFPTGAYFGVKLKQVKQAIEKEQVPRICAR